MTCHLTINIDHLSVCCKNIANLNLQQDYMFKEHTKHQLYHYFYNFASTNTL